MSQFNSSFHINFTNNTTTVQKMSMRPCYSVPPVIKNNTEILYEKIDFAVTGPLLALVIIIGVMCNIFCLVVFGRRFKRIRIYFYLLVLAAWDLALIVGSFFMFALPTLLYGEILLYGVYSQAYPFFYFFCNVARNGSVWILVVLALERYFALCHPYKFSVWNTSKRVYTLLSVVSVAALIYGIPRSFELVSDECMDPMGNSTLPTLRPTAMRMSKAYWFVYRVAGGFAFYSVGPFILLTALTICISLEIGRGMRNIAKLRKQGRRQSQWHAFLKRFDYGTNDADEGDPMCNGGGGERQNVNHWLHVAVITKFLIFHSMPTCCDVVSLIDPTLLLSPLGHLIGHISNLFIVINSSCNFFIYLHTSEHFKRDFADCVCRRSAQKSASFL